MEAFADGARFEGEWNASLLSGVDVSLFGGSRYFFLFVCIYLEWRVHFSRFSSKTASFRVSNMCHSHLFRDRCTW